jgi:hypothetical protein
MLDKTAKAYTCLCWVKVIGSPNPTLGSQLQLNEAGQFPTPSVILMLGNGLVADEGGEDVPAQADKAGESEVRFVHPVEYIAVRSHATQPQLLLNLLEFVDVSRACVVEVPQRLSQLALGQRESQSFRLRCEKSIVDVGRDEVDESFLQFQVGDRLKQAPRPA